MDKVHYLSCSICNKYYRNPIALPCGETTCQEHLEYESQNTTFACPMCPGRHPVPTNGFLVNKALCKALKIKVHLSEAITNF